MKESIESEMDIRCGNNNDSKEKLERLCKAEAEKLLPTIEVPNDKIVRVPCWTDGGGFAELICICNFSKDANGAISFDLDFTESTL